VALITIAIVGFVIYRWRTDGFDWAAFGKTFIGVSWGWLIASLPFILGTYVGRALRWRVMVQAVRPDSSLWNIFVATVIGFTAIVFFGRAGELVRPYLIATKERVSFSSQVAAWLLERILDLMMVLLIFGVALAQVSRSGVSPGPGLKTILQIGGTVIGVTGATCLVVLLLFRYFTDAMRQRLMDALTFLPDGLHRRLEGFLAAFLEGMKSTRSNTYVVLLIAYSFLEWLLIIACYLCLLKAFPVTSGFTLTDIVIFMGFVSFGAAIQIPGVGGGVQVASVFMFTEFFRMTLESATGMALVLWAVTFVSVVPFGMLLAVREGLRWRSLSHISEEAAP
jgi:uncharacterized protein (TIRG00374 family)